MRNKSEWINLLYIFLFIFAIGNFSVADSLDWNILQKANIPFKPQDMMKEYLNKSAMVYLKSFEENPNRFPEKENIESYKNERRALYWSLLGGKPEPTPLNPVVVRKGTKSTYRYEVLYFESQPNFYVSAILFLPLSQPPYPCVIVPCGHSQEAKGYAEYQKPVSYTHLTLPTIYSV